MKALVVLSLLGALCAPTWANAQQNSTTTDSKDGAEAKEKKPEKIEVTGSRIRRIDVEGPSPITTIEAEDITQSGVESVGDLLRDQTFNAFGSRREKSGGNFFAESNVDLRGVGVARTLVLLNGKRIAKRAGVGAVDLNLIPMAAVEKIEILRDGASAIYGTDALGGVVNVITKKNFNGSAASVRLNLPEDPGGESRTYTFYQGTQNEKTSTTTMVTYNQREALSWTQRPGLIGRESTRTFGGRGNYRNGAGQWVPFPDCPEDKLLETSSGTSCVSFYADESVVVPAVETFSILNNFRHQITDNLELFGGLWGMRKSSVYNWGPYTPSRNFTVSNATAKKMVKNTSYSTIFDDQTGDVTLQFQLTDLGNEVREVESTVFGGGVGLKGPLPINEDWEWEAYVTEDRAFQSDVESNGAINKRTAIELMENGKFNPFGTTPEARGSLADAEIAPWMNTVNYSREATAQVSGPVFEMPAGPIQAAVGVVLLSESFEAKNDPIVNRLETDGQSYNGGSFTGYAGGGGRKVYSAFLETSVPVMKDLEAQLAARYDRYSDFGSAVNPKVALKYRPFEDLLVRASAGTGFRAPTLDELYRDKYQQYTTYKDRKLCPSDDTANSNCSNKNTYITAGGNPDLEEEGSESFSLGLGYEPIQNLSLTVDYWSLIVRNTIGFQNLTSLTEAEGQGYDIRKWATITRDASTDQIISVVALNQNLGRKEARGLDYTAAYALKTDLGKFSVKSNHSVLLTNKSKDWPGAKLEEQAGNFSKPKWRNKTFFRWDEKPYAAAMSVNVIGPQQNNGADVKDYAEWGLNLNYKAFWNAEIGLGVQNLFDRPVPTNDDRLYSYLGRRMIVEYTQNF
jgi:iron complex outermembrane receptor protein